MSTPVLKSSATLNAVAKLIPLYCGDENRSFLQCKKSSRDPASCLAEGTNVTACVFKLCVRSPAPAFHFSRPRPAFIRRCAPLLRRRCVTVKTHSTNSFSSSPPRPSLLAPRCAA